MTAATIDATAAEVLNPLPSEAPMSNVTVLNTDTPPRPKSVTLDMADRFGMEAHAFEATIRGVCGLKNASPGEFAAFLLVAKQHGLNPLTREIYAMEKKGGGLVPVVGVDGWLSLINRQSTFDGFEFEELEDDKGGLKAVRCTIHRADRKFPISITERLSECYRDTAPWKMARRMLRHKALIQAARYAYGFSGIFDEDEAERIVAAAVASALDTADAPAPAVEAPKPSRRRAAPTPALTAPAEAADTETNTSAMASVAPADATVEGPAPDSATAAEPVVAATAEEVAPATPTTPRPPVSMAAPKPPVPMAPTPTPATAPTPAPTVEDGEDGGPDGFVRMIEKLTLNVTSKDEVDEIEAKYAAMIADLPAIYSEQVSEILNTTRELL